MAGSSHISLSPTLMKQQTDMKFPAWFQVVGVLGALFVGYLLGYLLAYLPGFHVPVAQSLHHWQPTQTLRTAAPLQVTGIGWAGTRTPYFTETVTFFQEVLQLPLTLEGTEFAEFTLPSGTRIGVFAAPPHPFRAALPSTWRTGADRETSAEAQFMTGPMLEFQVPDVDQARSQLEAQGVVFIGEVQRNKTADMAWTQFWGPDGYPYGLTSAPIIPQERTQEPVTDPASPIKANR